MIKKILVLSLCAALPGCATSQEPPNQRGWFEKLVMCGAVLQDKNPSATLMDLERAKREKELRDHQDKFDSE